MHYYYQKSKQKNNIQSHLSSSESSNENFCLLGTLKSFTSTSGAGATGFGLCAVKLIEPGS